MLSVPVNQADHVLGPATAKVTVVEYADFECAYCRQAHGAVKIMRDRYQDRVRFVFRHFPLAAWHSSAELAAEVAEAAGAQNKFWPMVDLLFEHQRYLKDSALREYAASLELDMQHYDYEMNDRIYVQRVRDHQEGGVASHVRGTPTFFVNGEMQDVSFGMQHLTNAIDAKLHA
jgi:protein-disulfide isomerase